MVSDKAPKADWRNVNAVITKLCKKQVEVRVTDGPKKDLSKMIKYDLLVKKAPDEAVPPEDDMEVAPPEGETDDSVVAAAERKPAPNNGENLAKLLLSAPGEFSGDED